MRHGGCDLLANHLSSGEISTNEVNWLEEVDMLKMVPLPGEALANELYELKRMTAQV